MARPDLNAFSFIVVLLLSSSSAAFSIAVDTSPRPITDEEIKEKKDSCYADVDGGLWGWGCRASVIDKENCALRCLSPVCYDLIYESDPLEEGERDHIRSHEYKYCMRRVSVGHSIDVVKGTFDDAAIKHVKGSSFSFPGGVRFHS